MRWRKIGLWTSSILVGIIFLAAVLVWSADLGMLKPRIERWVTETTGRDFRIGDLSIDVSHTITVVGKNIRFANAEWADPDDMVSVGHLKVQVNLRSIFSPPVVIEAIEIDDAAIELAVPEDGNPNWLIEQPSDSDEESPAPPSDGVLVLLRDARVSDVRVVYVDAERPAPLELTIDSATQHRRSNGFLDLTATGALSGREVSIEGEVGTWRALLAARDVEYDLTGRFDTLTLEASGRIDDLSRPVQPTLNFEAQGPDIDDLTRMLGLGDKGTGNIAVKGGLVQRGDGMELDLEGNLGETRVDVRADFLSLVDFSRIDAEVRASGPDLSEPMALAGVLGLDGAPFQLIADVKRDGKLVQIAKAEMLYGDIRFLLTANLPAFPAVDDGSIELSLQGSELARIRRLTGLPGAAEGAFAANAALTVDGDKREHFEIDLETSLGRLAASGEIRGGATFLGSTADVELEVNDMATFARAWRLETGQFPEERLTASGAFEYVDDAIQITRPVTVSLGDLHAGAEGRLALAPGGAGSNLVVEASADRLTWVTDPFTRSRFVPPDPFSARTHVMIEPGLIRFEDLEGQLGTATVNGQGSIRLESRIAGSMIEFKASGAALETTLAYIPELEIRPGPFEASGKLRFAADALHLEDITVDRPIEKLVGRLSVGMPASRKWLALELEGRSEDVRGALSRIPEFEPAKAPLSVDLAIERDGDTITVSKADIALADARFSAEGPLNLGEQLEMSQLRLTADVPSLARLGSVGGREFQDQAFGFDGVVSGDRGQLRIDQADIRLADSDMTGFISVTTGQKPILRMDVVSERLLIKPLFVRDETKTEQTVETRTRVIPDVAVPFDALAGLDAYLKVSIAEFQREKLYLRDVVLDADIEDGALELRDLSFHARSGYLRANGRLEPDGGTGRARLRLLADRLAFGTNPSNLDLKGTANLQINIEATGNDLRSLASTATGIALLDVEGGAIANNRAAQFFFGGVFEQIFMTINPFMKTDPETGIDCIVVPTQLTNGLLTTQPEAFVRTDKLNIAFDAVIDLDDEGIEASIRSVPRKALSISAAEIVNPYLKVIGTLAAPALAVDEKGALITSGAAVATMGLSFLAKAAWDRLRRSSHPCRTVRENATAALADRFPDIAPLEHLPTMPAPPSDVMP
jgi:uncharacterized protein involved in outer membrane biogenesis